MKDQSSSKVFRANRDGHVLIPSDVVSQLGVSAGEGLQWLIEDGRLVLTPRINLVKRLIGLFGQPKRQEAHSSESASRAKTPKSNPSGKPPESGSEPSESEVAA